MTPTPRALVAIPTPAGITCGIVEVRDNRIINPTDAQVAEDCFWQAYQQCTVARNASIAVRYSTVETPYVDSTQGPAYISTYSVQAFTVIAGTDTACVIRGSRGSAPYRRTQAGTPFIGPGTEPYPSFTCAGVTRAPDGTLHVIGCEDSPSAYDIPHP